MRSYVINQCDKFLLNVLLPEIKREFELSDSVRWHDGPIRDRVSHARLPHRYKVS
jgi:hypothetical protein